MHRIGKNSRGWAHRGALKLKPIEYLQEAAGHKKNQTELNHNFNDYTHLYRTSCKATHTPAVAHITHAHA
jgi:hypothetical protein